MYNSLKGSSSISEFVQSSVDKVETNSETNENPAQNIIGKNSRTFYLSAGTGTTTLPLWVKVKLPAQMVAKVELVNQLAGVEVDGCTGGHGILKYCSLENSTVSLWLKGNEVKECGNVVGLNTESVEELEQTYTVYCWEVLADAVAVEKKAGYLSLSEIRIYRRRKFCNKLTVETRNFKKLQMQISVLYLNYCFEHNFYRALSVGNADKRKCNNSRVQILRHRAGVGRS